MPDLVNMKAYIKFGENLSICSQDIERKRNYDERKNERNDRQPKSYKAPPPFSKWGNKKSQILFNCSTHILLISQNLGAKKWGLYAPFYGTNRKECSI